jgi:hypothetical protein
MALPRWFTLLLTSVGLGPIAAAADYLHDVKPLLTRHCISCHGADQQKGGLRLDTGAGAIKGGDSGPAVVPRDASRSLLVRVVIGEHETIPQMPYKKPPLGPQGVSTLRSWIDDGAPVPSSEEPGRYVHWAFLRPERPRVPDVSPGGYRVHNAIDAFILARLERDDITPSPQADRGTLLRRVYLDLIGLPPTPAEVEAFLANESAGAYEQVVDALLSSPHHGERWARWWLDVARYADSNGYSIDAPRSMWPWRDWVIRSFNADMPFDQFIVEQLAGDLLPGASLDQRIATGFHRNTQINQEGGIDPEQFRIESVIDRVNTTGTAFLGLTVACAQCHDHKFDPITQVEYFRLFAFFNDQDEPTLPLPTPEEEAALQIHQEQLDRLEGDLAGLTDGESTRERREQLEAQIKRHQRSRPRVDTTLVLTERTEPRDSYVFIKGDFTRRGPDVWPGTPAVLQPIHGPLEASRSGTAPEEPRRLNRLDLARWIVDPENPLTARVIVNRVWQQYFGRGLVETENDFGTQGIPPTHPHLLDWLATELIAREWSLKAIHRLIVTSATYRQSSNARPDLEQKDPTNRLLARQNRLRLDAEVIRDAALAASGKLDTTIGGPSVYPPQPDGVMNLGQVRRDWKVSSGGDRYRRGLYTFFWRATPHPALAVFDAPDAFSTCTRRPRSNTPLQALTLLNDAAFLELADAMAHRVTDVPPEADRVDFAFQLCLGRTPNPAERDRLQQLLEAERRDHGEAASWQTLARVLLNLDEAITRE